VELAIRVADDGFPVNIHAATGAPLFRLGTGLPMANSIAETEKGEECEEQKRDGHQKCIPVGEEYLCGQLRPPDGLT
jgi:hypothetical protein